MRHRLSRSAGHGAGQLRRPDNLAQSGAGTRTTDPAGTARLATVVWVGARGGRWSTPINWSTRTVPGPDDHVYIGPLPAGTPVTITGGEVRVASLVSDHDLVLGSGVLDVASASTVTASFSMNGGVLTGAGDFVVTGALAWSGGLMSGPARTVAAGALTLGGQFAQGVHLGAGRVLENRGAAIWRNGHIGLNYSAGRGAGRFINAAGASFEIRAANYVMEASGDGDADDVSDALFQNFGTIIRSVAGGATISAPFDNHGMIDIAAGTLGLAGRGTLGGIIDVAAGAALHIRGLPHYLTRGPSFRNCPGRIVVSGMVDMAGAMATAGTLELAGTLNASGAINAVSYRQQSGVLAGPGDLHVSAELVWAGGQMTGTGRTVSAGALTLLGLAGVIYLDGGRVLENRGTAVWKAGYIWLNARETLGAGRLVNAQGGTFEIGASGYEIATSAYGESDDGSAALFENFGTVTFSASPAAVVIAVRLHNEGTLDIDRGHVWLRGGGMLGGAIDIAGGASIRINSGSYLVAGASLRDTPGVLGVGGASVELVGALATAGALELTAGAIHADSEIATAIYRQSGGVLSGAGELYASSELALSGGLMSGAGRTISSGLLTLTAGTVQTMVLDGGRVLENRGMAVFSDTHIDLNGGPAPGAGRLFNADGARIDIQAGSFTVFASVHGAEDEGGDALFENRGIVSASGRSLTVSCRFINSGTLDVAAGTLMLDGGGGLSGAIGSAAGTSIVFGGGTFLAHGPAFQNSQGVIRIAGASVELDGLLAHGGALELSAGEFSCATGIDVASYRQSGGTLRGAGDLHARSELAWLGGVMTGMGRTVSSGSLVLLGRGLGLDAGRVLENRGAGRWSAGYLDLNAGSAGGSGCLSNAEGATLVIDASDYQLFASNYGEADDGSGARFDNFGTLVIESEYMGRFAVQFENHGLLEIRGGILQTFTASVNTGRVVLGSSAVLHIYGDFGNSASGHLRFQVSGPARYGRIVVDGMVALAGSIGIEPVELFRPAAGLSLQVLRFAARTGMFDAIDPESPEDGLKYEADYSQPNIVAVTVVTVP